MADVFYARQKDYIFRLNKMAEDLQAAFTQVQADWTATTGPTVIQNKPVLATVATSGLKADVGLGNVDNTSDINKPVSTAVQAALNLKASVATLAASGGAALVGNTPSGSISAPTVQGAINELATEKEPVISPGTTSQYYRGDKSFQDLGTDVRATVLTGLSTATSTSIVATDSVVGSAGKLQAQINSNSNRIGDSGGFTFRNRIINGGCVIAQRATFSYTNNISGYSGPDRFYAINNNGGGSFTQSLNTITFGGITQNSVRQTVVSAVTNLSGTAQWSGISQLIEGVNCFDLKNKPIVVSFVFNSNVAGTYSVAISDSTRSVTFLTSFTAVANTPLKVVVKAPAVPNAAVVPNTTNSGLSINIGAINNGTYAGTASAAFWQTANLYNVIGATSWGSAVNNFIEVTELQLEAGTINTEFERRPQGIELALCQRYFVGGLDDSLVSGYANIGQAIYSEISFPMTMRVNPTMVLTSTGTTNAGVAGTLNISPRKFRIAATLSQAGAGYATFTYIASAEL